ELETAEYKEDNNVFFLKDDDGSLYEAIPKVSYTGSSQPQGSFILVKKNAAGDVILQKTFPGWPRGIFKAGDRKILIIGNVLNINSNTRGIFSITIDA